MKDISLIDDNFINKNTNFPELISEIKNAFITSTIEVPQRHHHDFSNPKEQVDSSLLLKVTQGEITSIKAKPR